MGRLSGSVPDHVDGVLGLGLVERRLQLVSLVPQDLGRLGALLPDLEGVRLLERKAHNHLIQIKLFKVSAYPAKAQSVERPSKVKGPSLAQL